MVSSSENLVVPSKNVQQLDTAAAKTPANQPDLCTNTAVCEDKTINMSELNRTQQAY